MTISQNIHVTVALPVACVLDFNTFKIYNSALDAEIEATKRRNGYDYIELISRKIINDGASIKIVALCRAGSNTDTRMQITTGSHNLVYANRYGSFSLPTDYYNNILDY
jgi:hypothetical protein